jgi:hypothetical protein
MNRPPSFRVAGDSSAALRLFAFSRTDNARPKGATYFPSRHRRLNQIICKWRDEASSQLIGFQAPNRQSDAQNAHNL